MTGSVIFVASLLVGQYGPVEQAPLFVPKSAAPSQESVAAESAPTPRPTAVLGAVPWAPRAESPVEAEEQAAAPLANSRFGNGAPAAPLTLDDANAEPEPRRTYEVSPPRGRTVHTVEPGHMMANHQVQTSSNLAAALLERALTTPRERALHGKSLTLTEALSAGSRSRGEGVRRYWQCVLRMAEYYSALDEYARLMALPAPQAADARLLLSAAQTAAKARADEAELEAASAQFDLGEAVSGGFASTPPLPTDVPLVAAYRTHFEAIFADETPPSGLKRIHETLPLLHRSLHSRAAAVVAAEDAAGSQEEGYRRGSVDLNGVLAAHESIRAQRRAFFGTVLDYNERIAQYSLAVAGSETPSTFVATLVEKPALPAAANSRSVLVRNLNDVAPVAPAAAAAPLVASETAPLPSRSWQNSAPTSRSPLREAQIPALNGGSWK